VGILRNSLGEVDPDKAKTVKDRFMAALKGNREPVVMGRGWEFQQLSISPEESQFLGTMGYTEAQCARIFGPGFPQLLGYEVGGSLTYATLQDFDITLLKYSLNKWFRRLERVLFDFLPRPQYAVLNRDALLETSTMQRYQAYAVALANQPWQEVNEVRLKENLPALEEPEPAPEPEPEDLPADDDPEEEEPDDGEDS
jgi:phage portal protein BeeE